MRIARARTARNMVTAMVVVAAAVVTVGCGSSQIIGRPLDPGDRHKSGSPPVETAATVPSPVGTTATVPDGPAYRYVADLCHKIDFSPIDAILPFAGEVQQSQRESDYGSSTMCTARVEGDPRGLGSLGVEVFYRPDPAEAADKYQQELERFRADADEVSELSGSWASAELAVGNGVSDSAARVILHDGVLVVKVQFSASGVQADDRAVKAVQAVTENIMVLSAA